MQLHYQFINKDDSLIKEILGLKPSFINHFFNRIVIDFMYNHISHFKKLNNLFLDFVSPGYESDFADPAYVVDLALLVEKYEIMQGSLKRLMQNEIANVAELAELNPKLFFVIKLFSEIKIDKLQEFCNYYKNKRIPWLDLVFFVKHFIRSLLILEYIPWDQQDIIKMRDIFGIKPISKTNLISNFIIYTFSIFTKFTRNRLGSDPAYTSHLYVKMSDAMKYILDNYIGILAPVLLRMIGFIPFQIYRNKNLIISKLSFLFNINSTDIEKEIESISSSVRRSGDTEKSNDRIIVLPPQVKTASLLVNNFLGLEFFQDQVKYPDYIMQLMTIGFKDLFRFKDISHLDNMNFACSYAYILHKMIMEVTDLDFLDHSIITEIKGADKDLADFLKYCDYFYIKLYNDLSSKTAGMENANQNEIVQKLYDEINSFKRSIVFKYFSYKRISKFMIVEQKVRPIFDIVDKLREKLSLLLDEFDKQKGLKQGIERLLPEAFSNIEYKDTTIKKLFEKAYPIQTTYEPKNYLNCIFMLYNFLVLGSWAFSKENSFFNFYPSEQFFVENENEKGQIKIIDSADYYMYNKLNVEVEKFKNLAYVDKLTGCYNKNYFETEAKKFIQQGILLYFDLDNFKVVNDKYSHKTGDEVLKIFGTLLLRNTRKDDFPFRMGGDEFIIVLNAKKIESGIYFASRIKKGVDEINEYIRELVKVRFNTVYNVNIAVSAGIVQINNDLENALHKADEAMYVGKNKGKDTIVALNEDNKYVLYTAEDKEL